MYKIHAFLVLMPQTCLDQMSTAAKVSKVETIYSPYPFKIINVINLPNKSIEYILKLNIDCPQDFTCDNASAYVLK